MILKVILQGIQVILEFCAYRTLLAAGGKTADSADFGHTPLEPTSKIGHKIQCYACS